MRRRRRHDEQPQAARENIGFGAESELFDTMRRLFHDRAVLLISHRFSSVRMADRIYVLRDGAVTENGTHDELMAGGGHYAEPFGLQAAAYTEPAHRGNGAAED